MSKTITFTIPCYNSAEYMDRCIESVAAVGDDIEIIIVDDGSTKDNTAEIADSWAARYPDKIVAIHQENKGHGGAVNTGLANARGTYFKVVDSDDWLDDDAMGHVMAYLRKQAVEKNPTDMVISNYVYEKVHEGTSQVMDYRKQLPVGREFTWSDVGHFGLTKYILMHSVIYRTELLRGIGLQLPEHTFYVDNIYIYEPLPAVKKMYYLDEDVYRYFIGRSDQSVNENVMITRMDQQLKITRIMIDAVDLTGITCPNLRKYMENYLSVMLTICAVFLRMRNEPGDQEKLDDIWAYLKKMNPITYRRLRRKFLNLGTNLPTELGRRFAIAGYHVAQHIVSFN